MGLGFGGAQTLNKTATMPGKERLWGGGSPSRDYTSWTRKCFGRVERASVESAAVLGVTVGLLAVHAECLGAYAGCVSGCPDKETPPQSKCKKCND